MNRLQDPPTKDLWLQKGSPAGEKQEPKSGPREYKFILCFSVIAVSEGVRVGEGLALAG
jgi:hypothetical protein